MLTAMLGSAIPDVVGLSALLAWLVASSIVMLRRTIAS
jgi:hypothetical protein